MSKFNFKLLLLLFVFFFLPLDVVSAKTYNFVKYPGNPIFTAGPNGFWDLPDITHASIIKDNGSYKMWYVGAWGQKIGYASSPNGIDTWTKNSQPVLVHDPNEQSTNLWELEIQSPTVIYTPDNGLYNMWYVSKSDFYLPADRYRLRYATSTDGINWTKRDGWVLVGTPGTWDEDGIMDPYIIYKDGIYHLWYASFSLTDFKINIGYATSMDGISWTKQNNGNPVVTYTEPWEMYKVRSPVVLFENNQYKMWYSGGVDSDGIYILYAYSSDGIHWTKPADENPVLSQGASWTFDHWNIVPNAILNDNNVYKLWYVGNDNWWSIGLASDPPITPTPTLSSTPTPTPTPTSTPTPTPTPTPPPGKKVVVIPGTLGSWNRDALFGCKLDKYSGGWTAWFGADGIYKPLLQKLATDGFTAYPFYYDWRKPVTYNATLLKTFINSLVSGSEKVHIVGHSMGGLVARAYVEQEKTENKADKVITVGSPHQGTLQAYSAWAAGAIEGDDPSWRFIMTLIQFRCAFQYGNRKEATRQGMPSVQNMLPTFDYLKNESGKVIPVSSMKIRNNWLPTSFSIPFYGASLFSIAGNGESTLKWFTVKPRSASDIASGYWEDGRVIARTNSTQGDNTVLSLSALISGAKNQTLPLSHIDLAKSAKGVEEIVAFLENRPPNPVFSISSDIKNILFFGADQGTFLIIDPQKRIYRSSEGQVTILNPLAGTYQLRLFPTSSSTQFTTGQVVENGGDVWKQYTFTSPTQTSSEIDNVIQFDPINPSTDPMVNPIE